MANKRTLKHGINLICEELFAEAVAVSLYDPQSATDNGENTDAILFSIIKLHDNYIRRISHPEPGLNAKKYFKDLRERFTAEVDDIINQING